MAFVEGAVIVLLLMFNGFLAMSEIAIVSSRRSRLEQLVDAGRIDARTALALAESKPVSRGYSNGYDADRLREVAKAIGLASRT